MLGVILVEDLTASKPNDFTVLALSMLEEPIISVIVPVYNQEQTGFLVSCIDSLVNQSLSGIEIICIDDASTDSSLEVLRKYAAAHSNITVIAMAQNSRQGTARNRGIEAAKGGYIAFVDSDDYLEMDFYEKMYRVAKENDCDAVESSFRKTNEQGAATGHVILPHGTSGLFVDLDDASREYYILNHGMIWSYLFKSDLLKKTNIRFPEKIRYEDTPTFPRLLFRINRMGFCSEAVYYYRSNASSTNATAPNDMEAVSNRVITADMIIDFAKKDGYYNLFKDALDYYYLKVAVVNTLHTISEGSLVVKRRDLKRLARHTRSRVPAALQNKYIKKLSLRQKFITLLALKLPKLYCVFRKALRVIVSLK